jgi:hypothetical protein
VTVILVATAVAGVLLIPGWRQTHQSARIVPPNQRSSLAATVLKQLAVRQFASKNGYSRKQFSDGWAKVDSCTVRDKIMARDMVNVVFRAPGDCTVESGILNDPYTGKTIHFIRGPSTSSAVQIDHVVAISNTWQTGAQELTRAEREKLYNDSLELIAVDGPANEQKGDGDAAAWLPSNSKYDCPYVARQIAVKKKYHLWVTVTEHAAMEKVLRTCPEQLVPAVTN